MAQKKRKKKQDAPLVSPRSAMIGKEGLRWKSGEETGRALLALSARKNRLGFTITAGELKEMAAAVRKEAAEERRAFAAGMEPGAPAAHDWRNVDGKDYVKEVKNQGPCASGICFATCSVIESNMRIKTKDPDTKVDRSVAFMLFCGGGDCNNGLGGLTSGLEFARTTGVPDEDCFPYQSHNMPCSDRCSDWQSRVVRILSYTGHSSMEARKNAIAHIGPVLGAMRGYSDFMHYTGGVYWKASGSRLWGGGIPLCIVGYNDAEQYWIAKLSWGKDFGENGFCRIGYGQTDLLIDSSFPFYSVDPDVEPAEGSGPAQHVLIDKYFGGGVRLWAYAGGTWRHRNIPDAELSGIAQELFAVDRVDVWWDRNQITRIRAWKSP
jgi:hypothetical protein